MNLNNKNKNIVKNKKKPIKENMIQNNEILDKK